MESATILIVEDEVIVAQGLAGIINDLGYRLSGMATTGPQGIHLALEGRPDLILMDIALKGEMDGIEAAARIHESEPDIPIVFLTAYADEEKLRRAQGAEPYGYLIKPVGELDLKAAINMALVKSRQVSRLRRSEAWLARHPGAGWGMR